MIFRKRWYPCHEWPLIAELLLLRLPTWHLLLEITILGSLNRNKTHWRGPLLLYLRLMDSEWVNHRDFPRSRVKERTKFSHLETRHKRGKKHENCLPELASPRISWISRITNIWDFSLKRRKAPPWIEHLWGCFQARNKSSKSDYAPLLLKNEAQENLRNSFTFIIKMAGKNTTNFSKLRKLLPRTHCRARC